MEETQIGYVPSLVERFVSWTQSNKPNIYEISCFDCVMCIGQNLPYQYKRGVSVNSAGATTRHVI